MIDETNEPSYLMLSPEAERRYLVDHLVISVLPKREGDSLYATGRVVFGGNAMPTDAEMGGAVLLIGNRRFEGVTVSIQSVEMDTGSRVMTQVGHEPFIVPLATRTWWEVKFTR